MRTGSSPPPSDQQLGRRDVVLDQRLEQIDHGSTLGLAGRTEVDLVVVESTEHGQRFGRILGHPDPSGGAGGRHHAVDEGGELFAALGAASPDDHGRELVRRHDAGGHRVFEVVADVGDAIRPRHHFAFGRGRVRVGSTSGCGPRRASRHRG